MADNRFMGQLDDAFNLRDVGSTLLNDLAKGLYDFQEVIREYVQNAVGAHREWRDISGSEEDEPIQIEIRPNSISILDYGTGMDEKRARGVKAIAVSAKQAAGVKQTGYKGVGVWAGLSFFTRLVVDTTALGHGILYHIEIDFK